MINMTFAYRVLILLGIRFVNRDLYLLNPVDSLPEKD